MPWSAMYPWTWLDLNLIDTTSMIPVILWTIVVSLVFAMLGGKSNGA